MRTRSFPIGEIFYFNKGFENLFTTTWMFDPITSFIAWWYSNDLSFVCLFMLWTGVGPIPQYSCDKPVPVIGVLPTLSWQSFYSKQLLCLFSINRLFVCLCCGLASAPLLNTLAISLFQCSRSAMAKKQTPPIDRPWCYHTGASLNGKPDWKPPISMHMLFWPPSQGKKA